MDLPEGPPGAEGYEDSVTIPARVTIEEKGTTKAEQEFFEHLNSLKIKVENGSVRPMVERRGRDGSGKWIYYCFPCAAICSGENILQTHLSGKKHKNKLSLRSSWPASIFEEQPYKKKDNTNHVAEVQTQKTKMLEMQLRPTSDSDKYTERRNIRCHIQDQLDSFQGPLLGLEYLIEHPPEEPHHEPSYLCTLCMKQGAPRTILNHLTCFQHRVIFLGQHFPTAMNKLTPYRVQRIYREGFNVMIDRLANRIVAKYGLLKPVNIDKEEYEANKEAIHQWIFNGHHISERLGQTFDEVIDIGLIKSLQGDDVGDKHQSSRKDTSPPGANEGKIGFKQFTGADNDMCLRCGTVPCNGTAPCLPTARRRTRSRYRTRGRRRARLIAPPAEGTVDILQRVAGRQERRQGSLSDVSEDEQDLRTVLQKDPQRSKILPTQKPSRYQPYEKDKSFRSSGVEGKDKRPPNYDYKLTMASKQKTQAIESATKTLAYHEKNPEKHPLYPEEWKKFWNRRYKEIQAEGKDPSKHDFKPEWIVFWTKRMKEIHNEELHLQIIEIYRKLRLTPPPATSYTEKKKIEESRNRSLERRRSLERHRDDRRGGADRPRRMPPPPDVRRSSPSRRLSPAHRRPSPPPRRSSPSFRRSSPSFRRPSPSRRPSPPRRPSPSRRPSPPRRLSPLSRRLSPPRRRSPPPRSRDLEKRNHSPSHQTRMGSVDSRSTASRQIRTRSRSPHARTVISLESIGRSRSPLSQRESVRNRSPAPRPRTDTVLVSDVSDDDLKPDDGLSPWNSDHDSIVSVPEVRSRSRTGSVASSRRPRPRHHVAEPADLGPAENVVATLRLLVALEDYLGSLGPKIIDLLTEALRMEKESANSSEELLERETAVGLIETAKEKLKGAVQAGLVPSAATAAVRAAVVRAAATIHEADKRTKKKQAESKTASGGSVCVAGVGSVQRAQIAAQMARELVAQGKTDVSPADLAALVDAVVGMAEAKKRAAEESKRQQETITKSKPDNSSNSAASALQLLQSAYDENDKKAEKEDAPQEAMDRLSDSDLETLLKNFGELSAEEQHSLIAYLKKLEAREPTRVERLRQYVGAAVAVTTSAPLAAVEPAPVPAPAPSLAPTPAPSVAPKPAPAPAAAPLPQPGQTKPSSDVITVVPSDDDDDYTVEEVFKSATQKVKENQIRQEMEIVKKSLEEFKPPPKAASPATIPGIDFKKNLSSATDLLALVQASIKSTSTATPVADVVSTTSHPRSFGDSGPHPTKETNKPLDIGNTQNLPNNTQQTDFQNDNFSNQNEPSYNQTQVQWDSRQNWDTQQDNIQPQWDNQGAPLNDPDQSWRNQNQNWNNQNQNWDNQNQNWNNQNENWNNQNENWDNQGQNWGNNGAQNWEKPGPIWENEGQNWNNQDNSWGDNQPKWEGNVSKEQSWDSNQAPKWEAKHTNIGRNQNRGNQRGHNNFNRGRGNFNGNFDSRQNQNPGFRGRGGGRGNFRGGRGRGGF